MVHPYRPDSDSSTYLPAGSTPWPGNKVPECVHSFPILNPNRSSSTLSSQMASLSLLPPTPPLLIPDLDKQEEGHDDAPHYAAAIQHAQNHPGAVAAQDVNVDHAAHREYYDENDQPKKRKVESGEEDTAGTAIFTQVMKTMGGGDSQGGLAKVMSGGGGSDQLMSMVLSEASQMMGGETDGGVKSAVMQKVAMMALKSQLSGGGGGGGMGTLMGMASKFM
ncbi:hypothetical protein B0H13DRAFT_1862751 [Mycena leptocephala]|nr:hypothetical protein B0H13DRAFT_1862751 [Mycena leptocephala]